MIPKLIPFEPAHLGPGNEAEGQYKKDNGPAFTAVAGETILACGGVLIFGWGGVGEAWLNNWGPDYHFAIWFHRAAKKGLERIVREKKLWRLQVHVFQSDTKPRKWIERLGFLPECVRYHYGPDAEDAVSYYRIYRENLP